VQPRGPWPVMQLRFGTNLTSEQYVSQESWRNATLERCPLHGEKRCGFRAHGTYGRKGPSGVRIARFYCRKGRTTFSLLPDFAAARLSETLAEVEETVELVESASSLTAVALALRPELNDARSAVRWVRRRVQGVERALLAMVTLLPELFGIAPRLAAVRLRLGIESDLLVRLRAVGASKLHALQIPLGFCQRSRSGAVIGTQPQHKVGPDPASHCR